MGDGDRQVKKSSLSSSSNKKSSVREVKPENVILESVVNKIEALSKRSVIIFFLVLGVITHFTGLISPFQGDDTYQITNNPVIHSISHLVLLFEGGTFYFGGGIGPLSGSFYRPLMSASFSLLYSLFGSHPLYYHLFQLIIFIFSSYILYLVLRFYFNNLLSLLLAAIFLVHPLNSQIVYGIPAMQDALYFFFGILSIWLLHRSRDSRSLILASLFLFLVLLSKESGVYFIVLSLMYLFWNDKKRLLSFSGIISPLIIVYLVLRINAVGLLGHSYNTVAPIYTLNFAGRLMTMPTILEFYLLKFIFPWKLASAYYWIYPNYSNSHFLLPFLFDVLFIGLVIFVTLQMRKRAYDKIFKTYMFFLSWFVIGLIPLLQIVPLDMTVCETWFCISMVGLLGMIGAVVIAFQKEIDLKTFLYVSLLFLLIFGGRTLARGVDWNNPLVIYKQDASTSSNDYAADIGISAALIKIRNYNEAEVFASRSINIKPTIYGYFDLGSSYEQQGKYNEAVNAYLNALRYGQNYLVDTKLGELSLFYMSPSESQELLNEAVFIYPRQGNLWELLALAEAKNNDQKDSTTSINNAAGLTFVPSKLIYSINNDQPTTVNFADLNKSLNID